MDLGVGAVADLGEAKAGADLVRGQTGHVFHVALGAQAGQRRHDELVQQLELDQRRPVVLAHTHDQRLTRLWLLEHTRNNNSVRN